MPAWICSISSRMGSCSTGSDLRGGEPSERRPPPTDVSIGSGIHRPHQAARHWSQIRRHGLRKYFLYQDMLLWVALSIPPLTDGNWPAGGGEDRPGLTHRRLHRAAEKLAPQGVELLLELLVERRLLLVRQERLPEGGEGEAREL